MAIQKSIVMLSNTSGQYQVVSDKFRADGWWGHTDGLHTVQLNYTSLIGKFSLQGTLSLNPEESDWFYIDINNEDGSIPCVEYNGETGIAAFSFVGNFTFLRVKLTREDMDPEPQNTAPYGHIDKVLLSL